MSIRKNREAQVIGQVFIFLLGAFVVGGVLLVGYRAIANLGEQQCLAQETEFVRKIETTFDNSLTRGLVRSHTFNLPCEATALCFVERSAIDTRTVDTNTLQQQYPLIANSIVTGEGGSVWVRDENGYRKIDGVTRVLPVADYDLNDPQGVKCFSGDVVTLRFEGRGQSVYITEDR